MTDPDTRKQRIARVVAKAWTDEDFLKRLKQDPQTVLREHDIAVPDNVSVHVHENDANTYHLVLPPKPEGPIVEHEGHHRQIVLETGGECYTYCQIHLCGAGTA
jgi:hypothetical protein